MQIAITTPTELLKIRLQLQTQLPGHPGYVGPIRLLRQVAMREGITGKLPLHLDQYMPYATHATCKTCNMHYMPCKRASVSNSNHNLALMHATYSIWVPLDCSGRFPCKTASLVSSLRNQPRIWLSSLSSALSLSTRKSYANDPSRARWPIKHWTGSVSRRTLILMAKLAIQVYDAAQQCS